MTTITWSVTAMDCYPQKDEHADVVFTVHWECNGVDGVYSGRVYSSCAVFEPTRNAFIPYEDLTQDIVLGWIWANGVDQAATEAAVQQQIFNQINPPVITPPLPWTQGAVA